MVDRTVKLLAVCTVILMAAKSSDASTAAYITGPVPFNASFDASITTAMDTAFGVGGWDRYDFESGVPSTIFGAGNYDFLYFEGSGEFTTDNFDAYVTANQSTLESWVGSGGSLLLNGARWSDDPLDVGFGATLVPDAWTFSASAATLSHPIFNGATGTAWTGTAFAGNYVTGSSLTPLIVGEFGPVLSERNWGSGRVMIGGMTPPLNHNPPAKAQTLLANIFQYGATGFVPPLPPPGPPVPIAQPPSATPHGTGSETFDHDSDAYEPGGAPSYDWTADANADGTPPPGWQDIRTGSAGIIEEVPTGFAGVAASQGANFGVVYAEDADGPSILFDTTPPAERWWFTTDLYTDPALDSSLAGGTGPYGTGSNSTPDFWWTNAVANSAGDYLTESGITAEILDDGFNRVWRLTTTQTGNSYIDVPVGTWLTLEVEFHDNGIDGHLAATHFIWNSAHTELLYWFESDHVFLNPFTSQFAGPQYSWFTNFEPNANRVLVDNLGIATAVPEPGGITLAALGFCTLVSISICRPKRG